MDKVGKIGLLTVQEVEITENDGEMLYKQTDKVIFTGDQIKKANAFNTKDNKYGIMMELATDGAAALDEATGRLIGKPLGVYLDKELLCAPIISQKLLTKEFYRTEGSVNFVDIEGRVISNLPNWIGNTHYECSRY